MTQPGTPYRQCIHRDNPQNEGTRCRDAATYILLDPPLVYQRQPSPIWLPGESPTLRKAAHRPTPLYCREHAYQLCGLELHKMTVPL